MSNWDHLLRHTPSPVQEIQEPLFLYKGVRVLVKRGDVLYLPVEQGDYAFCGNKWRKMKYNLLAAQEGGYTQLCTFGGAFSNHIAASAAAGVLFGFKTIGIIRGELHEPLNPTLAFARRCGMQLHYVDRETYRHKSTLALSDMGKTDAAHCYVIPEGGTNSLALKGCVELAQEILQQVAPDICCISCGTGGTAAGLIQGFEGRVQVLGFPALKGNFMEGAIAEWLEDTADAWQVNTTYHFGGYARQTQGLLDFIRGFEARHQIVLDRIYTAKLFYGVLDMIQQDAFPRGTTLCIVHTGGIQGNAGFCEGY